jgi:hypothetical protein
VPGEVLAAIAAELPPSTIAGLPVETRRSTVDPADAGGSYWLTAEGCAGPPQ